MPHVSWIRSRDSRNGWRGEKGVARALSRGRGVGRPGFQRPQIPRDPAPSSPQTSPPLPVRNTDPGVPQPSALVGGPHRQVHKTQGGDNAADEADDEGAVWHEHHFGSGAHGHPSRKRGVLDVHLGREGQSSVLSRSLHPHALALGGKGDSQCVSASQEPAEGPGPSACVLCTSSLGTVRGHKSCVPAGETSWHVCMSPVNLCAQVCMSDGLPVTYADIRPVRAQTPEPEPVGLRRLQAYLHRVLRCRLRG